MKRVFIIHGWGGSPDEGWFPWLGKKLKEQGFEVQIPAMPNTDEPTIQEWVGHLSKIITNPNNETYVIGHSIGCQAILRYLETLDTQIGGAVFVAGWFSLTLDNQEEIEIAKPWLNTPMDFGLIRTNLPKSIAIFSDNDSWVPTENSEFFAARLGSKTLMLHNKGHFSGSDGIEELPEALQSLTALV